MNYLISRYFLSVYFIFSIVSTILFLIGIVGIMPLAIGLTVFIFCFALGAVKSMLTEKHKNLIHASVFWGVAILICIQVVLLYDPSYKLLLLYVTTFLLLLSVIIVCRFGLDKRLYLLLFLISQITGTIYFNF